MPANGFFSSTLVVNGIVVGTWKRTLTKNKVLIEFNHLERLMQRKSMV